MHRAIRIVHLASYALFRLWGLSVDPSCLKKLGFAGEEQMRYAAELNFRFFDQDDPEELGKVLGALFQAADLKVSATG